MAADRERVDPTVVMEGGAVGAAAIGFARMRSRRPRVSREPIDLERLAAEFAAPTAAAEPATRNEQDILHALEAELERVNAGRATGTAPRRVPAAADPFGFRSGVTTADPVGVDDAVDEAVDDVIDDDPIEVIDTHVAPAIAPEPVARVVVGAATPAANAGLPPDQIRAWLERVQEDLRRVEARVEYLQVEQARLQTQHRLVAELISSSTPV